MTKKFYAIGMGMFAVVLAAATSGCVGIAGPGLGLASIPLPVSPFHQQKAEDQAFEAARYKKVAVLPPITEENHIALDPPSDDQVVRKLNEVRPVDGAVPGLEVTARNIRGITKELISDYVDPPRVIPLIGPAQLHHAHYKCTVYFEEITNVGWPLPHQITTDGIEVLFIDKDHFHQVGGGDMHAPAM